MIQPPRPAHLLAQQIMALSLQLGGISRAEVAAWLSDAIDAVPETDRGEIIDHMLGTGILFEEAGVLGLGPRGEREFGRRHFSDLVAAFSEPLLFSVRHGPLDVGSVHPASLVSRRAGDPVVLSLGGMGWKVTDIDWRRRVVSVVGCDSRGHSRWLGSSRAMSAAVCSMIQHIVAGAEPVCRLSRRAEAALAHIRDRLFFVDADSVPIVSDGHGRVTIWAFAGGAATASIATALAAQGLPVIDSDDLAITLKAADVGHLAQALRKIDPDSVHPSLPEDLGPSLKFGLCLPTDIIESILKARTSDPTAVAETCRRRLRLISVA